MKALGPIIIVEDDKEDQEVLAEVFAELKIENEIKFFKEGTSVLAYLRTTSDKPFIIITDINMPMMNGLELKAEIYKDEYLRKKSIPFIFLSTTDGSRIIDKVYQLEVQGFFQKEFSYEAVSNQIKLIIDYWSKCKHPNNY
jgi:CheY-like chemotaxis protein